MAATMSVCASKAQRNLQDGSHVFHLILKVVLLEGPTDFHLTATITLTAVCYQDQWLSDETNTYWWALMG